MAGNNDLPKVQSSSGINDIAQLMASLGPLFGSGKSTTKNTIDPKSGEQADDILAQIAQSVNPDNLDMLTQNIMERAKQTFAPVNISPNAAGMRAYSDTSLMQLRGEASARATGEAVSARLNAVNQANAAASNLVAAKMSNTRSTESQTDENKAGEALKWIMPAAFAYKQLGLDKSFKDFNLNSMINGGDNSIPSANETIPGSGDSTFFTPDVAKDSSSAEFQGEFGDTTPLSAGIVQGNGDEEPLFGSGGGDDNATGGDVTASGGDAAAASDELPIDFDTEGFFDGGIVRVKGYADGGTVRPGADRAPQNYTQESLDYAAEKKKGPTPAALQGVKVDPTVRRKGDAGISSSPSETPGTDASLSADSSSALASGPFSGTPGVASFALAAASALTGNLPGAVMALAKGALMNDFMGNVGDLLGDPAGVATSAVNAGMLASASPDPSAAQVASDATMAGATMAAAPDVGFDPGGELFGTNNSGTSASAGAPGDGGGSFSNSAPGGGTEPGGGGDGGGAPGGGDGGGEADGGIQVADNTEETTGIDKKLIHVTPGEAVLPVDTVDAVGEDFINMLIQATHTPVNRQKLRKAA